MLKFNRDLGTIVMSQDRYNYAQELVKGEEVKVEDIFDLTLMLTRWHLENKGYRPKNVCIMEAHGSTDTGKHLYWETTEEGARSYGLDEWLDEAEKDFDAILVVSCNRGELDLRPRRAVILYPKGLLSSSTIIDAYVDGEHNLEIVKPK